MKKIILLLFVCLLVSIPLSATKAYIISRISPVYQDADYSADRIGMLKLGDEIDIVEVNGDWCKITSSTFNGYVQKMFTGDSPSAKRDSSADSQITSIEVRKRSASYTSSAAAARGLTSENVRDRSNVKFNDYDFESINWLEKNFSYSEDELIDFSMSELYNL